MSVSRVGVCSGLCDLLTGLVEGAGAAAIGADLSTELEKLFLYCLVWSVGGLLEFEDRVKFDAWLRERDTTAQMPVVEEVSVFVLFQYKCNASIACACYCTGTIDAMALTYPCNNGILSSAHCIMVMRMKFDSNIAVCRVQHNGCWSRAMLCGR
jgi:Dynein heavy chain AAA lid domain